VKLARVRCLLGWGVFEPSNEFADRLAAGDPIERGAEPVRAEWLGAEIERELTLRDITEYSQASGDYFGDPFILLGLGA
jgi:hypothetical protein